MPRNHGYGEGPHRQRGPDLPKRSRNRESFQQYCPYPSDTEEEFARHHADLYGDEENLIDGQHIGSAHFPRRSERATIHSQYRTSNPHRDRTRVAYNNEVLRANAEYRELDSEQIAYYNHTSGGMLPRHHATLLPLARDREGPNYQ